ncbi:MAG TPA: DUF6348 family protein [Xanthobacteraceae bacterium]
MMSEHDVVQMAAHALEQRGHPVTRHESWLEHRGTKFVFQPRLIEVHPLKDGGVRSVTTMATIHPELASKGIFEYQHATGNSLNDAVSRGFDDWAKLDLVVLMDSERDKAQHCAAFEMAFPPRDDRAALNRRALLGPVMHYVRRPPQATTPEGQSEEGDHPFCPCCLLTNTFEAFRPFIEADGFFGVRLVAVRDEVDSPQADCRVNGENWEEGARALRDYVERWPQLGYELRKQYVILQNNPKRQIAE